MNSCLRRSLAPLDRWTRKQMTLTRCADLKPRFRIAGEVLVIATLAGSAAAQSPPAAINTVNELEAAWMAGWAPPPIEQSRPDMQITVLMSFKRNGELFGQPRITFQ